MTETSKRAPQEALQMGRRSCEVQASLAMPHGESQSHLDALRLTRTAAAARAWQGSCSAARSMDLYFCVNFWKAVWDYLLEVI